MAKTLTMRLPDRVYDALVKAGEEWQQDPTSYLRMKLIMAGDSPGGITLKLDLPPVVKSDMPLFEAAQVSVEDERLIK